MRAIVCSEFGPPEKLTLGELPTPQPRAGEVAIRVVAAGVSFADTLMIRNLHQNKHALPFAPGMEVAGVVSALGEGVSSLAVGDRVIALVYDGGYAEVATALIEDVFPLADEIGMDQGAAISSAYLTSDAALRWEARLGEGETLLVLGGAGAVGLAAVELGRAMGATVIAAASSPEKRALAKEHGATHVIDYTGGDLKAQLAEIKGESGVDVVLDPVAGPHFEAAFGALRWGGRYVVIGFAGGAIPQIPANRLLVKNRSALGFALMHYRRNRQALLRQSAEQIFVLARSGAVRPFIFDAVPLSEAPGALRRIMDRVVLGKIILHVE